MTTWIKRILLFLLIIFLAVLGLCAYRMHSATRAVPVLNYHQINDRDENSLTVHTDEFDEQMKYLSDNGYHTITPEEMMDAWENGTPLPEKPVILTFDDGYVDNYKNAYPGEEAFGIFTQHEGRFTVFVGGFPIFVDGQCVGSVAASGGNGEQDIACCEAGIAAFMATLKA